MCDNSVRPCASAARWTRFQKSSRGIFDTWDHLREWNARKDHLTCGTCRLGQCRQGWTRGTPCRHHHWRQGDMAHHAAITIGGTLACDIHFYSLALALASSLYDVTLPATRMAAGPTETTCRQRRQGPAGNDPDGTCHVSPGQHHSQGVFFDKNFRRWSFLAFHSRRWSHMSKIPRLLTNSYVSRWK
jgi:hypothetical protein